MRNKSKWRRLEGGRGKGLEIVTERSGKRRRRTANITGGKNLVGPASFLLRTSRSRTHTTLA